MDIAVAKWQGNGQSFVNELEKQLASSPDAILFELEVSVHSRPPSKETIDSVVDLLGSTTIPTALVVDAPRFLTPVIVPIAKAIHGAVVSAPMMSFDKREDAVAYFQSTRVRAA